MKKHWSMLWAARYVAKWEGEVLTAYLDTIASPPVWTIGSGHTRDVHPGDRISRAESRVLLAADLVDAARAIARYVAVKLTARQRMAILSAVFNLGPGLLVGTGFIARLNAGDFKGAARELRKWDHAGGVVVPGLTRRRQSEAWLLTHPRRRGRNPHRAHLIPRHP